MAGIDKVRDATSEFLKKTLNVKDVKVSVRLSDYPSCIVADESDPTVQMQNILKALGQGGEEGVKPILEINPNHEIVNKLKASKDKQVLEDVSWLLFEQALLIEGAQLKNPTQFAKRLNSLMVRAIPAE